MQRLTKLVELSQRFDPRVLRQKEEEKVQKEAKKKARADGKKAEAAEKKQAEQAKKDEAKKVEEQKKADVKKQKEGREKLKKALRKARNALKKLCEEITAGGGLGGTKVPDEDSIVWLCEWEGERTTGDEIAGFVAAIEKDKAAGLAELNAKLDSCYGEKKAAEEAELKRVEDKCKRIAAEKEAARKARVERENNWGPKELSMLAKSVNKFPGGTRSRWQTIANYINTQLGLSELRTKEECLFQANKLQVAKAKGGSKGDAVQTLLKASEWVKSGSEGRQKADKVTGVAGGGAGSATAAAEAAKVVAEWSAEQQTALEAALKKYPSTLAAKERWSAISKDVPGKKMKECVARFKQIRAEVLEAKKKAAAAGKK